VEDKRTIGLTEANRKTMTTLLESGFFNDRMDIAKLAMSVAINNNVKPTGSESTETIWNVGSFDADGEIKALIQALFPEITAPYRAVEFLFNEGFRIIAKKMQEDDFNVINIIS
jgi:hypothetical protein